MARPSLHALVAPALCGLIALGALGAGGCGEDCCTIDSEPIPISRAPLGLGVAPGALLAKAQPPGGGAAFKMVIDTGSPITILGAAPSTGTVHVQTGAFDILDASEPTPVVRARFRNLGTFLLPLGPVGDALTLPGAVMGGDLLHAFSVEMRFAGPCPGVDAGGPDAGAGGPTCSSVTFWPHQGASESFLEDAGYAVLRFNLFGGGETTANSQADFLGLEAPVELPATRVVLRTCAAPKPFAPTDPIKACCLPGNAITQATGVDLALVLATGVGPMVLSQSAWLRIVATLDAIPPMTPHELLVASWPLAIPAEWTTLPRFALVDGAEPPSTGDQGACVDLGRARRIEQTVRQTVSETPAGEKIQAHPPVAACVQGCDTDPSDIGKALNSAAYLEIGGDIPVAVVDDAEPFLQALRFDIRTEGPDVDGVIGAGALGSAQLELDYLADPPRAIFNCEANVPREACYSAARCPRLPDNKTNHLCFGQPAVGLPVTCLPSGCP